MNPAPPVMQARLVAALAQLTSVKPRLSRLRVAVEHLHGLERELLEVLAEQSSFLSRSWVIVMMWQPTWSACTTLRTSRGEAQISSARGAVDHDLDRARHDRHRIDAGVGDPPGEDRDVGRRAVLDRRGDQLDLRGGEQRGDVDLARRPRRARARAAPSTRRASS